jgi:4-amino-4-deoxy-L-arabinose transferase-like glycosyltransferase
MGHPSLAERPWSHRRGVGAEPAARRRGEPSADLLRAALARVDPAIVVLMLVGLVAAFYGIGTKGLWLDEAFSAKYAQLRFGGLWHVVSKTDPNMGGYYTLLHLWTGVFGHGEAAVRSLSAVAGCLAIPLAVVLGTRLFGRGAGLLAGLLLALNPFFVQYEQIARSYTLLVLLILASCLAFVTALENPTRGRLLAYVLASALSLYMHYFAALVLLVQFATLLVLAPAPGVRKRWAIAVAALIVLCVPELVFAARAGSQGVEWIGTPTFSDLVRLPSGLVGGTALAVLLSALACYGFIRSFAAGRRRQAGFVAAWLLVPVALDFAASRLGRSFFVAHYLIVVLPALLLLAAAGVAALPRRALAVAACGLLVALMLLYTGSWYREPGIEGYRGATQYILGAAHSGDRIVYYPELPLGGPAAGVSYYETRATSRAPRPARLALASAVATPSRRVWLVIRNSDVPPTRRSAVERSMATRYGAGMQQTRFRNLTVILYTAAHRR